MISVSDSIKKGHPHSSTVLDKALKEEKGGPEGQNSNNI